MFSLIYDMYSIPVYILQGVFSHRNVEGNVDFKSAVMIFFLFYILSPQDIFLVSLTACDCLCCSLSSFVSYFKHNFSDVPVWSKLETGRIPQPPELFQIIDNHVRFNHNTNAWSDNI